MKKPSPQVCTVLLHLNQHVRVRHSPSFVCCTEAEAQAKASGEKEDYKGDSKFATHLKASTGVSSFARSRTLKEQREYLPAFACREDLMKVMRDNQGLSIDHH
jgi:hypothetical protein